MPLIKDAKQVEDRWSNIAENESIPESGDVILTLSQLEKVHADGPKSGQNLGVRLPNTFDISELKPYLPILKLVVLDFPAFTDGRAYSQAWHLRNELGFEGEVRATGNVLPDQAAFMLRAGFDSFEVEEGRSLETIRQALAAMTHAYQNGFGETTAVLRRQFSTT